MPSPCPTWFACARCFVQRAFARAKWLTSCCSSGFQITNDAVSARQWDGRTELAYRTRPELRDNRIASTHEKTSCPGHAFIRDVYVRSARPNGDQRHVVCFHDA